MDAASSSPSPSAGPSAPTTPTTPSSAADAHARREARKARILSKGHDRLAKLTKQARGEQAEHLYPAAPLRPTADAAGSDDDDPEEADISGQPQQDAMQTIIRGLLGDGGPGAPAMPDLSQLFAAVDGTGSPPGLAGPQPQQADTDAGGATCPPPLASLVLSRVLSLAQPLFFLGLVSLVLSSVCHTSPHPDHPPPQGAADRLQELHHRVRLFKWASLAYFRPSATDASWFDIDGSWLGRQGSLPIFYPLLLLSLATHLSRLLLSPPKPLAPSLLFTIASALPIPSLQLALRLFSRYASLLASLLDDLALLVFALAIGVLSSLSSVGTGAGALVADGPPPG